MQVKVAKAVLRRHWIQARHLPGTLRALKIAPMQDLEIAFACAALGLLERRAAEEEDLCAFLQQRNIDYEGDRQLDTALTYLERYLPTLEPNDIRTIQQILSTSAYANKKHSGPLSHPSASTHQPSPATVRRHPPICSAALDHWRRERLLVLAALPQAGAVHLWVWTVS